LRSLRRRLLGYELIYRRDVADGRVALTFDDGPSEWTPPILDVLAEHRAQATFFLLGEHVLQLPETAARIARDGHEVGCHAFDHVDLAELPAQSIREQLTRARDAISSATGVEPRLFRPPYATPSPRVARAAAAVSLAPTILRDVDPADWRADDADSVTSLVLDGVRSGSIVCLHDGVPQGNRGTADRTVTVAAVARLVPELQARGFDLVTVSDLLT
jgi:peptidoglycan/xylan/chitin deacetylase (PgdA/CDA1 family)